MPAFVPDIPYHIQVVFALTFTYIWMRAFYNDPNYNDPLPVDGDGGFAILRSNVLQSCISVLLFMTSFSYLNPYIDTQGVWM